jgi:hypothetical protein
MLLSILSGSLLRRNGASAAGVRHGVAGLADDGLHGGGGDVVVSVGQDEGREIVAHAKVLR